MFIAMNRFKVRPDSEDMFLSRWLDREVSLRDVPGFVTIRFMKGEVYDTYILYASETTWASREAFDDWKQSDAFRTAHRTAGQGEMLTIERRESNGFEVLKTVSALS
ncbi:antibiotic biosynthesis monooxygenase family protein [Acetobacter sicerae]|uniref:antibiotic biosynthesis monooxygenase family protein n=1 Tax=Acetobacter sicerae TaxID=85325 RepID=UPI00156B75B5|nr:antibiotic biosynthesis monooxygenase [Acetobacter sicerae]NHN91435.1 antibiotic biosynthesis monooxygenase [Acetobacter sicerae]